MIMSSLFKFLSQLVLPPFRRQNSCESMLFGKQRRESPEKALKFTSDQYKRFGLFLCASFFIGCSFGVNQPGVFQQILSRSLSLSEPELRTCVFDPYYSVVHFPMYHDPPVKNYSIQTYEIVVKSQFQLLHTIIDYHRSARPLAVFDEHITSDSYNLKSIQAIEKGLAESETYTKFNGKVFHFSERYRTANSLFRQGFPSHYEYLNELQKRFLFDTGASLTLYLLKEISQIHKVISSENLRIARANLVGNFIDSLERSENHYWVYTFRERKLREEVDRFYQKNLSYRGLVFIAYGAKHDLSDDFVGLPFQSGHDFCLKWQSVSSVLP